MASAAQYNHLLLRKLEVAESENICLHLPNNNINKPKIYKKHGFRVAWGKKSGCLTVALEADTAVEVAGGPHPGEAEVPAGR